MNVCGVLPFPLYSSTQHTNGKKNRNMSLCIYAIFILNTAHPYLSISCDAFHCSAQCFKSSLNSNSHFLSPLSGQYLGEAGINKLGEHFCPCPACSPRLLNQSDNRAHLISRITAALRKERCRDKMQPNPITLSFRISFHLAPFAIDAPTIPASSPQIKFLGPN